MPQVEVFETTLSARAEDAGYHGVVLEGALRFEPRTDGVAVVIDLTPATGLESDWIVRAVRGTISRMVMPAQVIVRHGTTELQVQPRNAHGARTLSRLPVLRTVHERSLAGPRLILH